MICSGVNLESASLRAAPLRLMILSLISGEFAGGRACEMLGSLLRSHSQTVARTGRPKMRKKVGRHPVVPDLNAPHAEGPAVEFLGDAGGLADGVEQHLGGEGLGEGCEKCCRSSRLESLAAVLS